MRLIDLAVNAGRKRQSPRTGFVHLFAGEENVSDTIPLFENFCFAMALFRQKTVESILEGKELVTRLLAFEREGNFPIYLHDFPKCYDPWMSLRVAPIFLQLHRYFGTVIGADLKEKIAAAIDRLLCFAESRNRPPLWEHRLLRLQRELQNSIRRQNHPFFCAKRVLQFPLQGIKSDFSPNTHDEWFHWLIGEQLDSLTIAAEIPYHQHLQAFIGGPEAQEKGEPRPVPIEWALAEKQGFSERLLRDHPAMLHAALLFPIETIDAPGQYVLIQEGVRLLWRGSKLHSFAAPAGQLREPGKIFFELSDLPAMEKGDLIEAAAFCDISPETELTINGKKGTVFHMGELVQICTPTLTIELRFDLVEGQGDFCGQISRANRPAQTACKGALLYEAFDWRIAIRTLRRSPKCLIVASMEVGNCS